MSRRLVIILLGLVFPALYAQERDSISVRRSEIMNSLPADSVEVSDEYPAYVLDTVILLPDLYFSRMAEYYKYRVLARKTIKVYPIALQIGRDLEKLDQRLSRMTPAQRRKYKKIVERYAREVFEPQLKNLTVTEGRVLTKLIYRQTGMSVYDFLKKYKSGLSALWWQTMARIYKIDLKMTYDPNHSKDDFWMEDILQRAFVNDVLEPTPSKVPVDYLGLYHHFMERMPARYRHIDNRRTNQKLLQSLRSGKPASGNRPAQP